MDIFDKRFKSSIGIADANRFFAAAEYDSAIALYKKSVELDPNFKLAVQALFLSETQLINSLYPNTIYHGASLKGSVEKNKKIIDYFYYTNDLYKKKVGTLQEETESLIESYLTFLYLPISNYYYYELADTLQGLKIISEGTSLFPNNYNIWYERAIMHYNLQDYKMDYHHIFYALSYWSTI